jgi:hypothetical protein
MAAAFASRRPFHARLWKRGIDSKVASAVAMDAAGAVFLYHFDNSPCGAPGWCAPSLEERRCTGPYLWTGASGKHLACNRPSFNQPVRVATDGSPTLNGLAAEPELPLRIGGDVKAPRVIHRVQPDFESCAREDARTVGVPIAETVIDAGGSVQEARLTRAVHPCFDRVFLEALEQWRFEPGTIHGRPVPTIYSVMVHIHFR